MTPFSSSLLASPDQPDSSESEVARRRREEILTAAEAIIASEGLPRLSLGQIEKRTGMSRGQLTYYFPTKEAILLAVFDRMLARMIADKLASAEQSGGPRPGTKSAWDCLTHAFTVGLSAPELFSEKNRDLFALVHTFLAQIGHREDFRTKLAAANAEWRRFLATDFAESGIDPAVKPDIVASIVMALMRGLTDQLAVDPNAFDRTEMAATCLKLLAPVFARNGDSEESVL